jgi:glucans biosynthesis protein C
MNLPNQRDLSLDYLRGAITFLVVAHHSALAYTTFSTFHPDHYTTSTAPVVDSMRWFPLDLLVAWNDIFFMSLMFFISGLFVLPALDRKGAAHFLKDRVKRLGIPFAVAVTLLIPMAYYPAWLLSSQRQRHDFLSGFFTIDGWPVGPPWFLWVLLFFSFLVTIIYRFAPRGISNVLGQPLTSGKLAAVFLLISLIAIIPVRLIVSPNSWFGLCRPFYFQSSRLFLYFAYFLLGVWLGGKNLGTSFSAQNLRRWPHWLFLGFISLLAHVFLLTSRTLTNSPSWLTDVSRGAAFASCCAFTSLALLGFFRRHIRISWPPADSFAANAYGIYIVHYGFVTWSQFCLLSWSIPAPVKFMATLASALTVSWLATSLLRRTPLRKII